MLEITKKLDLSDKDKNLVEMHSILNVLNVFTYEILQLSDLIKNESSLRPSLNMIQDLAAILSNREKTIEFLQHIGEKKEQILSNVHATSDLPLRSPDTDKEVRIQIRESLGNIHSLLDTFEIRASEIIDRDKHKHSWVKLNIKDLKMRFKDVFYAIEKNGKGRYSFVTDETAHDDKSYLIQCELESTQSDHIYMPPELEDTMRDLMANARKYTEPGGRINTLLLETESELILKVQDNGKGIPQDQIESIIDYGVRGTNVRDKKSYGGGFGITKAYYTTKVHGGRMWVNSVLGKGTEILIKIPLPRPY